MSYQGNTPAEKYQTLQKQSFTTSATDTYTLDYAVTNPQDLGLYINNVYQNPHDAYSVSNTTLTLSSAITSSDTMYAIFLGKSVETVAPALSSVTNDMLAGSIANSKLANSSITLNGSAVSLGGSASVSGGFDSALLHIQDQKSSGTKGGTSSSTTTHTRDLNTIVTNEITGASLSSNQITLPSGTYYMEALLPSFSGARTKAFFYSVTDGSNEIIGQNARTNSTIFGALVSGRFTTNIQRVYELRHYFETGRANDGLGLEVSQGTEIYSDVKIWKVA